MRIYQPLPGFIFPTAGTYFEKKFCLHSQNNNIFFSQNNGTSILEEPLDGFPLAVNLNANLMKKKGNAFNVFLHLGLANLNTSYNFP
jgi:hypothetical protein